MKSLRTRLWILSCWGLSLVACQYTQAAKEKPGVNPENEVLNDEKSQIELWSPARRKANASFYYLTGEYEALSRNGAKARKLYENAYNLDPNPFLAVKLIEMRASEDIEDAIKLSNKMVLLYPEYAPLQLMHGRLQIATGNIEKAEGNLILAKKLDPEALESYVFLIHLYQSQEKYKQAIAVAKELLKVNASFAEGWTQLARLHMMSKQYKEALEPARRAYDIDPNDPERVQIYALALDLNGEKKKAAQIYDTILKLDPTNDDLIARMVSMFKVLGSLEDGIKQLKNTEKMAGGDVPGIKLQMVFIYWELQQFAEASELLDAIAKAYPQSERITYMSGLGQERIQQWQKALDTYKSFDESSEFYGAVRFRSIEILKKQGDLDAALVLAREAMDSQSDRSADFYPVAAQILAVQKKFAEAAQLLSKGFVKHTDRVDFLFLKAVNLERAGSYDDCVTTLKGLLEKDPQHAAAHNYLGYMYAERRVHLDEAESHIKKALEIKPDDGYYLDSLGWVYFQQGQLDKALETLLRADEQVANEGVILEHIADTYQALGQVTKAIDFYDKALQTKIDDSDRSRISEKRSKLGNQKS